MSPGNRLEICLNCRHPGVKKSVTLH